MAEKIAAVATGHARTGIGILRLSGDGCIEAAGQVFHLQSGKPLSSLPDRKLALGTLFDVQGRPIDHCMAFISRAPHSYTGEDTAEHCRSGKEGRQFSLENVFHGDSSLKLEIDEFLRVESGAVRAADGRHCQQDNPDRVPEPDSLQQLFP